jgi:N-acylneuraminate cytidylyltransferase/CMP-N,N'-diacetyllegionaminic acid synthase
MASHLILIPARSGSTRVPDKNIRNLGGKPLLSYAIESAVDAKELLQARVIVSTDSEKTAAIARRYGAETPFLRPKELSQPESTSLSAVVHALDWLSRNESWHPKLLAFRPPTCPFLSKGNLIKMFSTLKENGSAQSLNTIFSPPIHPYAIVRRQDNGYIEFGAISIAGQTMLDFERSQDYPKVWAQSAACRLFRTQFFYEILQNESNPFETKRSFCGDLKCLGYEISRFEAFDIDTEEDLQLAEALLLTRN